MSDKEEGTITFNLSNYDGGTDSIFKINEYIISGYITNQLYKTDMKEDQEDINKLWGFSFGIVHPFLFYQDLKNKTDVKLKYYDKYFHHYNSFRIGYIYL
jgi:hypothetical protein